MYEEQLKKEIEKYFKINEELSFEKLSEEAKKIYDNVQDEKISKNEEEQVEQE